MLISKFGTISKAVIAEFEDVHDIKFPETYRRFIELYIGVGRACKIRERM